MIVYAWPLFDPTSAPSASPRPPPAVLPVEKASTSIDAFYIVFSDFGLQDITSVKRHPLQRILGSLMSGWYLRIHETNNLNPCIRYITHHIESPLPLFSPRLRYSGSHRNPPCIYCSVVLLHYCFHSKNCRVTNPTKLVP
jgi:hypothetical protein